MATTSRHCRSDTVLPGVSLKVSEKGGVSVYGLGRFPITLYQEQWLKLLDMADPDPRIHRRAQGRAESQTVMPHLVPAHRPPPD